MHQAAAMKKAAGDATGDIRSLPPTERVMSCDGHGEEDDMTQCPGWGVSTGCWRWAGALTDRSARPRFDRNGNALCRPCSNNIPGLVKTDNPSSLGPDFVSALRSSLLAVSCLQSPVF